MHRLNPSITLIDCAVYCSESKTLSISDVHLGYEEALHKNGVMTPKFQLKDTKERLQHIFSKVDIETLIINGDLKHAFGKIQESEWSEILKLIDFLLTRVEEIVIVTGNHDVVLGPVLEKRHIKAVHHHVIRDILFAHGDEAIDTDAKTIIIGHDHPAITVSDGIRNERYKCHVMANYHGKTLIIQPSFHHITIGTDITQQALRSPFIEDTDAQNWHIYIVSDAGDVFDFGGLK
jgi:hypothetical protein